MLWRHLATSVFTDGGNDRPAVVSDDASLTYAELLSKVDALACALADAGIGPGHVVLAYLDNVPSFLVTLLATAKCSATFAPLDLGLTDAEAREILGLSGAQLVVCDHRAEQRCRVFADVVVCVDDHGDVRSMDVPRDLRTTVAPGTGCMQLSSGTTGESKGILLDDEAFLYRSLYLQRALSLCERDRTLCTLPLSHTHGAECLALPTLIAGGTLFLKSPRFAFPLYVLEELERLGITFFSSIPQFYDAAVKLERGRPLDLGALRHPFCGSAALSRTTSEGFFAKYGVHIRQGYGLAELSVICVNFLAGEGKAYESVGKPIEGIEWKLAGGGTEGELLVRSKAMFSGYIHNEALTNEKLRGGFLHTGDIVRVDADGLFRIVGRKDDFIKVRGFKVYASEIETAIIGVHAVSECAVLGEKDALGTETIVAYVVPRDTSRPGELVEREVMAHLRDVLSEHKLPRRVIVRDALPKSALGKVLKSRITAR